MVQISKKLTLILVLFRQVLQMVRFRIKLWLGGVRC